MLKYDNLNYYYIIKVVLKKSYKKDSDFMIYSNIHIFIYLFSLLNYNGGGWTRINSK